MSRKKKHEEHIDESWLIPYCDLLTLLLALFFALWAMSDANPQKYQELVIAFETEFKADGILEHQAPAMKKDSSKIDGKRKTPSSLNEASLEEAKGRIDNYIDRNGLSDQLEAKMTDEGLLIKILNNALFDSGVAEVRNNSKDLAKEISYLLISNPPRQIVISGHTDDVPINGAGFDSNWHLSVMRAVNFMKIILENPEIEPSNISAKGFGEFKPIAPNNTLEGRAKNRRVEVLIRPLE